MTEWFSASELVGLPGVPKTREEISRRASRDKWTRQPRKGKKGGGFEYHATALPAETRDALSKQIVPVAPITLPAPVKAATALVTDPRFVKDWQKRALEGRAIIVSHVQQLQMDHGVSQADAVAALVSLSKEKKLPGWLMDAARAANQRGGNSGSRLLSRTTLYKWIKAVKEGQTVNVLLPKSAWVKTDYPWSAELLRLYCISSNPDLTACLERLPAFLPEGVKVPSVDAARRFLDKLPFHVRNKGRIGPKEMRAHKAFSVQDIDGLEAGYLFIGDGHTFKAQVAHPVHGRPFRPEITTFLDVATRKIVGWSIALAENTWSVADALRHACETHTLPVSIYYDMGSGANNKAWDDDVLGMVARLGLTKKNSIPGNSQARGAIEIIHKTVMHKAAKWMPTYVGKDMSGEARFYREREMKKDLKETGEIKILPKWHEFIDLMKEIVATYNARPHSSLPKIADPATGRMRRMTPGERWDESIANGAGLFPLTEEEAVFLFRPYEMRKCRRALVSMFGRVYYNRELEPYHQEWVQVGYDIRDIRRVWVNDKDGRLICEAVLDGHRRAYDDQEKIDFGNERRVRNQIKRLEKHAAIAKEGFGQRLIEHSPEPVFDAEFLDLGARAMAEMQAENVVVMPIKSNERPKFIADDGEMAVWLLAHPDQITDHDRNYFNRLVRDPAFGLVLAAYGINAGVLNEAMQKKAAI